MFYSLTIDGATRSFPTFPALHGHVNRYGNATMEPNGTCTRFGRVVGTWNTATVTLTKSYGTEYDETDYRDAAVQAVARTLRVRTTCTNGDANGFAYDLQGNRSLDDLQEFFQATGVNKWCGATYPGFVGFKCTLPAGHGNPSEHHDETSDAPSVLIWHTL